MAHRSRLVRWGRWIVAALSVALIAIQFVPVERTNPPVLMDVDAPPDVARILRRSCYDCHSYESRWPWYAHVAPMSWLVTSHVNEARGDLNFSDWPAFDFVLQNEALEDIRKEVKSGDMPLASYLWIHWDARLSERDRATLLDWAVPAAPPGESELYD